MLRVGCHTNPIYLTIVTCARMVAAQQVIEPRRQLMLLTIDGLRLLLIIPVLRCIGGRCPHLALVGFVGCRLRLSPHFFFSTSCNTLSPLDLGGMYFPGCESCRRRRAHGLPRRPPRRRRLQGGRRSRRTRRRRARTRKNHAKTCKSPVARYCVKSLDGAGKAS